MSVTTQALTARYGTRTVLHGIDLAAARGRILGIVSIGDLVKEVIEDQKQEISYLQQYISS